MDESTIRTDEQARIRESIREAEEFVSPYERWKESQGLTTLRGLSVPNVYDVELTPWPARNGSGIFINLDGTQGFNDSYIYELAPKESSIPIKHIYEETIFILKGRGATTVWNDENKKQTFEWGERSYFCIPPNANHQHHNLSGNEPARYFAMTAAPRVIDTFKDLDFVFNCCHVFKDRFDDTTGYFKTTEYRGQRTWYTNFVADVLAHAPTPEQIEARVRAGAVSIRGSSGSGGNINFSMVNGTMNSGVAFGGKPGAHTKFHRHGPGIHVLTLIGNGYSLMWPHGGEPQRVDWGPGTVFVPPEMWWHAHYNVGPDPWTWMRIGLGTEKPKLGGKQYVYKSYREGGDQMEFDDEDPRYHAEFEAALAKVGVRCLMQHHPYCTQK